MNEEPIIHPRIHQRHPDITDADVRAAWHRMIHMSQRDGNSNRWVAIGVDRYGRSLELVATFDDYGKWLIFHAYTPPTKGILKELGML
ncbi:hypothetical protein [Bifidobacterium sp. ESL0790]|uniref:hypothetical protein n=1 Tax=Bifidobacterium sp. ESL0790 TaxID=2983233 RepID=UPI0023F8592F|nr:hypothetical protein [Bifidobacterium sp. ESL0790]WEV72255.1 hypothetical protein OZY47_07440 [Bifidobacterium sp. ESL0790]